MSLRTNTGDQVSSPKSCDQHSSPETARPPPAPPPPNAPRREKVSIALKVREAPPGWAYEGYVSQPEWDCITPPAGKYFFYGTLQDPQMLREILGLDTTPTPRPAKVTGYKIRLWGQYPALVDEPEVIVQGSMYDVPDEESAAKLAAYETNAYRPAPCYIDATDGGGERIEGFVFKYDGNPNDLTDGEFDLNRWLQLMGRKRETQRSNDDPLA